MYSKMPCTCVLFKPQKLSLRTVKEELQKALEAHGIDVVCRGLSASRSFEHQGFYGCWIIYVRGTSGPLPLSHPTIRSCVKFLNGYVEGMVDEDIRIRVVCDHYHLHG